jgi:hypothetical protein
LFTYLQIFWGLYKMEGSSWTPGKREANYSYAERVFDGAAAMWLRRSAEEAPEVGTYDYNNVSNVEAFDGGATDMNAFTSQWTTTLYGEQIASKGQTSEVAQVDVDTLLNDAWFCVLIEDMGKMRTLLERARQAGIAYPADHPIQNMFGESTLWSRITDSELKLPGMARDNALQLLAAYHMPERR